MVVVMGVRFVVVVMAMSRFMVMVSIVFMVMVMVMVIVMVVSISLRGVPMGVCGIVVFMFHAMNDPSAARKSAVARGAGTAPPPTTR